MLKKIFIITLLSFFFFLPTATFAQDDQVQTAETFEGKITKVDEERTIEVMGNKQIYQKLSVLITKGSEQGKTVTIENGNLPLANVTQYHLYDQVTVQKVQNQQGGYIYNINDFIRRDGLLLLTVIFLICTFIVARWKGFMAVVSMVCTFFIIFKFTLPQLSNGTSPLFISILTAIIVVPVTFYLSHGFNKKTHIAIIASIITLAIIGVLSNIFIYLCHLTGLSSEDAATLSLYKPGVIDMKDLLFASTIIGALGVLDDITIAQAAVISEIRSAVPKIKKWELYRKGMNVGRDHITSMVNTLILVYAGASLPLLLIFIDNPRPFSEIVNYEFIAEEIVRTLVGSVGLVLAVPITTLIAVMASKKQ